MDSLALSPDPIMKITGIMFMELFKVELIFECRSDYYT